MKRHLSGTNLLGTALLVTQLLAFGVLPAFGLSRQEILGFLGILPERFWEGGQPQALLTSLLLHEDWLGLFSSLFLLWMLLRFLEQEIGRRAFLSIFLVSGFLSGLPVIFGYSDALDLYFTARGGIWGLLAVLAAFYSGGRLRFLFGRFGLRGILFAFWALTLLFLLWNGFWDTGDWTIPITGALAGLLYAKLGLGLRFGGSLTQEPRLWYLKVEHPNQTQQEAPRRSERDYLETLQGLSETSASQAAAPPTKKSLVPWDKKPGLRTPVPPSQAASAETKPEKKEIPVNRQEGASDPLSASKAANTNTSEATPAKPRRKLIYDPKTDRMILKEEEES